MLKNIHPDQISFNKARRYYLHLKRQGHMFSNSLPIEKIYEVQLSNIIDSQTMNYSFTFTYNKAHGCRIRFIPYMNIYMLIYFTNEKEGHNYDDFLNQVMLYGSRNVILTICDNYKLLAMLICNKYNKNNETNKVLSDKYLMRFIASYL
jgi:hypothetical protein